MHTAHGFQRPVRNEVRLVAELRRQSVVGVVGETDIEETPPAFELDLVQ